MSEAPTWWEGSRPGDSHELRFTLQDIYRIDHIRDRPTEFLERTFGWPQGWRRKGIRSGIGCAEQAGSWMRQTLRMRTDTHPKGADREAAGTSLHAGIDYERIS